MVVGGGGGLSLAPPPDPRPHYTPQRSFTSLRTSGSPWGRMGTFTSPMPWWATAAPITSATLTSSDPEPSSRRSPSTSVWHPVSGTPPQIIIKLTPPPKNTPLLPYKMIPIHWKSHLTKVNDEVEPFEPENGPHPQKNDPPRNGPLSKNGPPQNTKPPKKPHWCPIGWAQPIGNPIC